MSDPLTEDEVRRLLRECVTVVKPGEILVLQPGADVTPNQLREIQWMTDPKTQFKIVAKYIENIEDNDVLAALIAKHERVAKEIQFPYVQIAAAEKPQRSARAGKRKF